MRLKALQSLKENVDTFGAFAAQVRRSISEALRAIEPSGETCDELLEHLEQSLLQVELSKSHAVLLKRAEVHLLTLLGALRDVLSRLLGSFLRYESP